MDRPKLHIPRVLRRKPKTPAPGSAPGTLAPVEGLPSAEITRFVYDKDICEITTLDLSQLEASVVVPEGKTVWLDVQGLGDVDLLRRIAEVLKLHPLTLEDIVHIHQRPKVEEFAEYLFIVIRAIRRLDDDRVGNEQIALIVKPGLLVTFQERPGGGFAPVRRRLDEGKGHIRRGGSDYLAYALMDAVIDNYYPVIEAYTIIMDQLDDAVRANPHDRISRDIHGMRREMRQLRRAVWPLRDVTSALGRDDVVFIAERVRPAFRDCYDHVVQVSDFIDGARERASELADLFLIMMGERTNQVMKVLTIIATVFIPLTFLCGLYGMNFDPDISPYNMPELRWRYGYPVFWAVMILVFIGMLAFFRAKGWLGRSPTDDGDDGRSR